MGNGGSKEKTKDETKIRSRKDTMNTGGERGKQKELTEGKNEKILNKKILGKMKTMIKELEKEEKTENTENRKHKS